jgi:DNA repair photolyase
VEAWLRRALLRREPIVLGMDGADPYSVESLKKAPPGFVRSLLQGLTHLDGLEIAITTRSPRVLQDLSLLTELDQRHTVRVDIPLPAVDRDLARRIEPREPEPEARLWAVSQLASEGIATRVVVKPLLPGVNDGEESLRALFEAALEAGACDVVTDPVPTPRRLPWRHRAADENRASEDLLATIRRLRLEHGFPRSTPGRG